MDIKAQLGDSVSVHYTGKLENGIVFDSSSGKAPLEFNIGDGTLITGFDRAIIGMKKGEKKQVKIIAENGYGPYRPELVSVIKLRQFPPHIKPKIGLELELSSEATQSMIVMVTEMNDEEATLDANHPLAGKDLFFEIELIDIKKINKNVN